MDTILVTGASGQLGTELVQALRGIHGTHNVLATDIRPSDSPSSPDAPFRSLDCTDGEAVQALVGEVRPRVIFHLAALLSAVGEGRPQEVYRVNLEGVRNVLEAARTEGSAVFHPSSIAVFGPGAPKDPTPQDAPQRPITMYGITKVTGELLCDYYHARFGIDTRGLRFPGLISHTAPPGGGSTDYAVEIFHAAVGEGRYTCAIAPDTQVDMLYMPDAVRAILELMAADPARLRHRNAFNVTAIQASPSSLAEAIRARIPSFEIDYEVDPLRERIAQSWPRRLDDSEARAQWDWRPEYDLEAMAADMLHNLEGRS